MIIIAYLLYRLLSIGKEVSYVTSDLTFAAMIVSGVIVFTLIITKAYDDESSFLNMREIERVIKGVTLGFLLVGMILVLGRLLISRYVFVFSYFLTIIALTAIKMIYFHLLSGKLCKKWFHKRVLIYGTDNVGQELYRALINSPKLRINPVGFIDDQKERIGNKFFENGYHTKDSIEVLGSFSDISNLIEEMKIDAIYISSKNLTKKRLKKIISYLRKYTIQIALIPDFQEIVSTKVQIQKIDDIPVLTNLEGPSSYYLRIKRIMDIFLSCFFMFILITIAPLIILAIKMDSPGPVLFRQLRVGKNKKNFYIYKFRTMDHLTKPYKEKLNCIEEQRVTNIGRLLRKTSLDELPQIINVLKGDMSLVGPRPEMPFIVETYNDEQMERLSVKPGITGLWQLAGDRNKPIHEHMSYDKYYIQNMSFFLDIAILVNTIFYAFRGK